MAYVDPNYKYKKEFITAVNNGIEHYPYNPSGIFQTPQNGTTAIEGPHFPQPHKWYASAVIKNGVIVSVK
jgi:hypothetical protein